MESPATEPMYDEPNGKGHLEERARDHQKKPEVNGSKAIGNDAANEGKIARDPKPAYVGAGEYGEGREDLVLLLPEQWLGDEASVSTTLVIGEGEVEGSEPSLDEESATHHIGFGSAYHAQQWKDDGVKRVTIRFEGNEPPLALYYTVKTPDDASEPALALETVEMGSTRFSP